MPRSFANAMCEPSFAAESAAGCAAAACGWSAATCALKR